MCRLIKTEIKQIAGFGKSSYPTKVLAANEEKVKNGLHRVF